MFGLIESFLIGISLAWGGLGPVNTEIIRRGIRYGLSSAVVVSLGATVVDFVYLALIFAGASQLAAMPEVQLALWVLGAIFLVYLGYGALREYFKSDFKIKEEKATHRNSFVIGILLGFSSPLAFLFYVGIFGPIVATSGDLYAALASGLAIICGIFAGELIIATATHMGRQLLTLKLIKFASAISGIILMAFGVFFGYEAALLLRLI